jgi:hypothetical protein
MALYPTKRGATVSTDTQDTDEPIVGGHADLMDLDKFSADTSSTEERLEQIIREADEEAAYHATEAKRRRGVAKAARQALNILREGDNS